MQELHERILEDWFWFLCHKNTKSFLNCDSMSTVLIHWRETGWMS